MAKLKKEDLQQLAEPIVIESGILGDEEFRIERVTQEMLEKVNAVSKEGVEDPVRKQLAILFSVDPEKFKGIDIRVLAGVVRFVTKTVTEALEGKNV